MRRREFLRAGLGGLSLSDVLAMRARAGTSPAGDRTALIIVWLRGASVSLAEVLERAKAEAASRLKK